MSNCPINDLIKYIKNKIKNSKTAIPEKLNEHILNCDTCKTILAKPYLWNHFISINKRNAKITSKNQDINENEKIYRLKVRYEKSTSLEESAFIIRINSCMV